MSDITWLCYLFDPYLPFLGLVVHPSTYINCGIELLYKVKVFFTVHRGVFSVPLPVVVI